ncbi:MAG: sigma 54-interacting transcriptional regulator, partial [Nannocystaceae bacterium]
GREVTGGRLELNDIVLSDDHVSGTHFRIVCRPSGELILRDEESLNGIIINGLRVRDATIEPHSAFKVGNTLLELTAAEAIDVPISHSDHFGDLYGVSDAMREVFGVLEQVARAGDLFQRILVGGETGTGKELVARALHKRSPRASCPFIVFDCTAVPRELVQAKLFGHRRGSFSGAEQSRKGCFRTAHTGTLFIDEIGELPLDVQGTLLRVLENEEVIPIGEDHPYKVDVRVVAATHRNLRKMIGQGKFREDLYYRLNGTGVMLPSLRDRCLDIVYLAHRFLALLIAKYRLPSYTMSQATEAVLEQEHWPGNVRQLRHVVESAAKRLVGTSRTVITPGDLSLESEP